MKEIKLINSNLVALVDDTDYAYLNQFRWYPQFGHNGVVYARRNAGPRKQLLMHRELLNVQDRSVLVDHEDDNGLNNQRLNLRKCSPVLNICRRRTKQGGYRGVCKSTGSKSATFNARIRNGKKKLYLGTFTNPEDAARAYDRKAKEVFGNFARLNFPDEPMELEKAS